MAVFSNETLLRFFNQGEQDLSNEKPFIVERSSIAITSGTSVYTLSDYIISIRRITYKGQKLDPLPQRNFREVFQSATSRGKPFWYIFNNVGLNKIQLFPCPNENVTEGTDLWDDDISTSVIIEYYRISDNSSYIIPSSLRRQLLKLCVAKQCFAIEGAGQNIKMSKYFNQRWEGAKQDFYTLVNDLYNLPRKLILNNMTASNYFPASPVLPIDRFGTSVDTGE